MKIRMIEARAVSVPVAKPTRIAKRLLDKRDYLVVEIAADDSEAKGFGYIYAGTRGGSVAAKIVAELLSPVLTGADADDIWGIWDRMYQETLLTGRQGIVLRAISAVDMALWDLAAKRRNMPLAVMLGGSVRPVPAYASGGYYRPDDGPWAEAVHREIRFNIKHGFSDHKIKVGGLPIREDADRVRAAIDAMDGQGRLALDANNAYRDYNEALLAARAFEKAAGDAGLWWFEEPLSPDDYAGHAELARRLETPVATGEIHQTRHEFRRLIEQRSADILQPDVGVLGGVSEWIRVTRAAESFGVSVAPHWHANAHAQLASATPNCVTVEHFLLDKDIYNFEVLVTSETRQTYRNGELVLTDRPGWGFDLDHKVIGELTVEHFALKAEF
ncbi:mandelate racemase/muconate lactonizing enzyme family protein [Rhizobium sp. TRM96647]|uniref:mandelate racemase/muconate lactonizing enzyme family protein n=1 Tax=unclassified Rhizobium TaxID=2613769 RepID=UPI0021E74D1C|nr:MULTISPECIES: mandelate racemase/muconate lactonizing enzyme family protein [unclassified Rhizobium]MCV3738635.1 mandelate racemase/muconate lactonizing enzyme family protein [Rhizobium sp. TRM96647]MCV3760322.1 mandelate racemase/muconate lactonizing enzyme family protein [Rhizobium sp. TRM96650]